LPDVIPQSEFREKAKLFRATRWFEDRSVAQNILYTKCVMMIEYYPIFIYFIISGLIAVIMIGSSWVVAPRRLDIEKASAYECGFDPFGEARSPFEVSFYLVSILFIIFDIEVAFLFPWAIGLTTVGWQGYISMLVFLFVLVVGFFYEWKKGALDWS
jgi:NADH:ubiquinone oxidoreductase subunit 3 (subunit A)